jgi:hypothetical protein
VVFAADPAEDLSAADGPPMRTVGVTLKPAFVKIYNVSFAILGNPEAQCAQKRYFFFLMTFGVSRRFFSDLQFPHCHPDCIDANPKMRRSFSQQGIRIIAQMGGESCLIELTPALQGRLGL